MTKKEKCVLFLVAFAIRCLYPSRRSMHYDSNCHRHEDTQGEGYDNAFKELIGIIKEQERPR